MDIYPILSSIPHNTHYLTRYFKFIESCSGSGKIKHHICPKAKGMFPHYSSLKINNWNCALLTDRQHFIAHWMLWKAYKNRAMTASFNMMNNFSKENKFQLKSAVYEKIRKETYSHISEGLSGITKSESHCESLKESWVNRAIIVCPHCYKESKNVANMYRYHFDNCKNNPNTNLEELIKSRKLTYQVKVSQEQKFKISETLKNNKLTCPHCNLTGVLLI
jgi:DnaJ-class molecular chaperone